MGAYVEGGEEAGSLVLPACCTPPLYTQTHCAPPSCSARVLPKICCCPRVVYGNAAACNLISYVRAEPPSDGFVGWEYLVVKIY